MFNSTKLLRAEHLERRELLTANSVATTDEIDQNTDELLDIEVFVAPIDGVGNNIENPDWGATDTQLLRLTTVEYADGISDPAGADRPSARAVSNAVAAAAGSETNDRYLTDLVWLWGQFIDHDITLSETAEPHESFDIEVPAGDPFFDPDGTGDMTIALNRSVYDETTGDSVDDPREQINQITAFLDGSMVYGSDAETADLLRAHIGGRMETSTGDLLPLNSEGFFEAGDIRANENAALTSMHTLWVREHNRIADEIAASDSTLGDEEIYQRARAIVIAELQAITYNEFLPALLGIDAIPEYRGYDATVNPGIANIFSTASYRFGHSMLSSELLRLNPDGTQADEGSLSLADAFFAPQEVIDNGIASLLIGAATQTAQEVDNMVIDDVRNFLFGFPGAGGFDLASLNIQRGRDHGLADYNQARVDMGLSPVTSFDEITSDLELSAALEAVYGSVDNIDAWVGALAEDHVAGSSVGELNRTVILDQFLRIRDGDRFWYENLYSGRELDAIDNTTLAEVIARNTEIDSLQANVFFDSSVMFFAVPAGEDVKEIELKVRRDNLEVVDGRTDRVLASQAIAGTEKIILVGGDRDQRFVIDDRVLELDLPGGIAIDGNSGGRDQVTVQGSRDRESFVFDRNWLTVNDMALQMTGVEELRLDVERDDTLNIVDDGDVRVVIDDGGSQGRGSSDRNDRGKRQKDDRRQDSSPIETATGEMPVETIDDAFAEQGGRRRR